MEQQHRTPSFHVDIFLFHLQVVFEFDNLISTGMLFHSILPSNFKEFYIYLVVCGRVNSVPVPKLNVICFGVDKSHINSELR